VISNASKEESRQEDGEEEVLEEEVVFLTPSDDEGRRSFVLTIRHLSRSRRSALGLSGSVSFCPTYPESRA
jgi:hypothetical protein